MKRKTRTILAFYPRSKEARMARTKGAYQTLANALTCVCQVKRGKGQVWRRHFGQACTCTTRRQATTAANPDSYLFMSPLPLLFDLHCLYFISKLKEVLCTFSGLFFLTLICFVYLFHFATCESFVGLKFLSNLWLTQAECISFGKWCTHFPKRGRLKHSALPL